MESANFVFMNENLEGQRIIRMRSPYWEERRRDFL